MRKIELLAPARDAEIGIEAFRHGADAVYIGAPRFSARSAAGNSVADIERLAAFGHQYGAHTMVAFNTIVRDSEMEDARKLLWQLYDAGVDSLIIQDFGLLQLDLPPIELHASTQTDNRTPEKVRLLRDLGFRRVVLARELSVEDISEIHRQVPDVELECFIHGALCVCFSGQCYLSADLTHRSANRGECAQPCRLPMDLLDADGRLLVGQKHLLSLKDMNRSQYIGQLIDAGVSSFKIEGRLKDMNYVKNVVSYYSQLIDKVLPEDLSRLSEGRCTYCFEPDVNKSFNRGFTSYFADGKRGEVMWNFESPKSMGEKIGKVNYVGHDYFTLKSACLLNNGDGLVVDRKNGFRLNRYDEQTGKLYPQGGNVVCRLLRPGMEVRRNLDFAFEQILAKNTASRRIDVTGNLSVYTDLVCFTLCDDAGNKVSASTEGNFELAKTPQSENQRKQLSKLGDSIYAMKDVVVEGDDRFVPASVLNEMRREAVDKLNEKRKEAYELRRKQFEKPDYVANALSIDAASVLTSDYKANVLNKKACEMYRLMGIDKVDQAFEFQPKKGVDVMQTKHCIKQALGCCPKYSSGSASDSELSTLSKASSAILKIGNKKFILKFGCKNSCISEIISIFAPENVEK